MSEHDKMLADAGLTFDGEVSHACQLSDEEIRIADVREGYFDQAFPRLNGEHRQGWLNLYLMLCHDGDSHSTAVETIRGEMMACLTSK